MANVQPFNPLPGYAENYLNPLPGQAPASASTPASAAKPAAAPATGGAPSGLSPSGALFSPSDINHYINPPADPRLNSILSQMKVPLRQGLIQQTDDALTGSQAGRPTDAEGTPLQGPYLASQMAAGNPQKHPFACRFMFNPTTLEFGYGPGNGVYSPAHLTPDQNAAANLAPGQTTLTFTLYFDRTYDIAYSDSQSAMKKLGVLADILALEQVVGARVPFVSAPEKIIQPMRLIPCYFIFGGGNDNVGVTFIGIITGLTVTYTSFSTSMVPMRCAVNVNATQMLNRVPPGGTSYLTQVLLRNNETARRIVGGQYP